MGLVEDYGETCDIIKHDGWMDGCIMNGIVQIKCIDMDVPMRACSRLDGI